MKAGSGKAHEVSDRLHERVRLFASTSLDSQLLPSESFETLALAIAQFQHGANAMIRRLSSACPTRLESVPSVPVEVFRRCRVATHSIVDDQVVFTTSGTTGGRGEHPFRRLDTYRELSVAWGRKWLVRAESPLTVLALAAPFEPKCASSLSFMMAEFILQLDGRGLADDSRPCDAYEAGRWLLHGDGVNVPGLRRSVACAERRREPVLLLATSFALVWLLDTLGKETLSLPPGSRIMHTGGFKGRTRSVPPEKLRANLCRAMGVSPEHIVSEYGMTELSSQLYDQGQGASGRRGGHVYRVPPWLKVEAVDPRTQQPLAPGKVGWARFTDLCNVDSAICLLTQDRIRVCEQGVELLGRAVSSPVRGCSIAVEELAGFPHLVLQGAKGSRSGTQAKVAPVAEAKAAPSAVSPEVSPGGRLLRLQIGVSRLVAPGSVSRRKLIEQLCAESQLSRGGVIRALDECLELTPSDAEVRSLLDNALSAPCAHIVLPGRVFAATYRALALALVSSPNVKVKASRRQSVFVQAIANRIPGLFEIVESLNVRVGDHIWVYGSDKTLESLQCQVPVGVQWHCHGTGYGAVAVQPSDWQSGGVAAQLSSKLLDVVEGIARDVALFDQEGCLSPRIVLLEGSYEQALTFAEVLAQALARESLRTPIGGYVDPEQGVAEGLARRVAQGLGEMYRAGPGWVSVPAADCRVSHPSQIAAGRRVLEVRCVSRLRPALTALEPWLTAVGCSSPELAQQVEQWLPDARVSGAGDMQRPAFDGPVDRRKPSAQLARGQSL